jgi:c(7)-type cytochrome triheme protein
MFRIRRALLCMLLLVPAALVPAVGALVGSSAQPADPAAAPWFVPVVPKPVTGKARRLPYSKPKPPPPVEFMEELPRTDWLAELNRLPRDANGGTDWVRALDSKLIDPKAGLDPKTEDEPVMDLDVELVPEGLPEFKATYPHQIHTRLLACANCHTGIFQMEKGADPITMEKIFAGEYCGRCHGKVAFDPATNCIRCHREMPK